MSAPNPIVLRLLDRMSKASQDNVDTLITAVQRVSRELSSLSFNYNSHMIRAGMRSAELEALVRSFNDSTRQAESGIVRLRDATEGAGRHITRQITAAAELKNELGQLVDRAEDLSDRLAGQIRPARVPAPSHLSAVVDKMGSDQSMTDRTLSERRSAGRTSAEAIAGDAGLPRVRSQAERDLLRALRVAR